MRRKSKKIKEEAKESSSERRSKRSSTRRKRAYEDDEGGSGVEEERTTEEEMTPTKSKDRGGRRYATRGRRQKAEESEDEEVSQAEEERVDLEEESSNNLPVVTEADDRENEVSDRGDDSKALKSGVTISDKSIASEGNDGASAWKSDSQFWGMKSGKNDQEDKRGGIVEETPAQGEGDDGEEEGSRSHSRKRKLKLSRECLQENREAIPKLRLRLSRNRSGGYETEKLEAERIETKRADEERLVQVAKAQSAAEGKEAVGAEPSVSNKPAEVVEEKVEGTEVAQQDSEEVKVVQSDSKEAQPDTKETEVAQPDSKETEVAQPDSKETEVAQPDSKETEVAQPDSKETEVAQPDSKETEVAQPDSKETEVVKPDSKETKVVQKDSEEQEVVKRDSEAVEVEQLDSKEADDVKGEVGKVGREKEEECETSYKVEENSDSSFSETPTKERKIDNQVEIEEITTDEVGKSGVCDDAGETVNEGVVKFPNDQEEKRTEPEVEEKMEVEDCVQQAEEEEGTSVSPVTEEKEDKNGEQACEKQVETRESEEERRVAEEIQEKQVSGGDEVSDGVIKEAEKDIEERKASDSEKLKDCVKEGSDDEGEIKGEPEEVVKEKESVEVTKKDIEGTESTSKDEDCSRDGKGVETLDDKRKLTNEGGSEHVKEKKDSEERNHKSASGERASRINRSKLRQDDDMGEELQNQKRRRRRRSRSRESSGSQNRRLSTTSVTETSQPKRVILKRPKLNRSTSSAPIKDSIPAEEEVQKEEPVAKVEERNEEESQSVTTTEEPIASIANEQENKLVDQSTTTAEDGTKKRRRKWGQQKSQVGPSQSKRAFISISTQSLKGLIPEVKPLPIHELRLSIEKDDAKDICMEEEESCEASVDETIVRMIDANGQNERTVWAQVVDDEMRTSIHPEAPRVPMLGGGDATTSVGPVRRISIVSDDAVRLQRSPSPPRHPPSSVLFLSNLVRPFTVQQLKELLARTGTVVEDGFWIDRIKSMCLVQYETEEQARETRHALHGVRWPISNPKRLWVDFATKERLEEAKREGNVPPPPPATTPSLTPPHPAPRDDFPRKTEPLRVDGSGMVPIHHAVHRGTPGSPVRQGHVVILQPTPAIGGGPVVEGASTDNVAWQQRGRPRPDAPPLRPGANAREFKLSVPIREWDLDKVVQQSPPRPSIHGPSRGSVDDRRRPEVPGPTAGRRDRMLPSPSPSLQEMQVRKAKRKEAEAAAAAAAEAPANLLDSLFRKTKATPSIYWLPLTAEQIKVKEEIRRQHLAEHERRMAEMKRAADKERGGRRRRRSSSPRRRSRRRSGEGSSAVRKKPSESMKGHKGGSASPKK